MVSQVMLVAPLSYMIILIYVFNYFTQPDKWAYTLYFFI